MADINGRMQMPDSLYEKGIELFGNEEDFNRWLRKPFWNSEERPIDLLKTANGAGFVMDELATLAYGDCI